MNDYKDESPYKGVPIICLVLIGVPLVFYGIVRVIIFKFQPQFGEELNQATAVAFGFGVGVLFHLACIIAGLMLEPLVAVITRVREFFSNLPISASLAFTVYFKDLKDGGVVFWIYLLIFAANALACAWGFVRFLELYLPIAK